MHKDCACWEESCACIDSNTPTIKVKENHSKLLSELLIALGPLIDSRLKKLCNEFCYQNKHEIQCTLERNGPSKIENHLCDWGNASYLWIIETLFNLKRLKRVSSFPENNRKKYFSKILYSTPFRERFKDWRFNRRIRVPKYIQPLHASANKIFWSMCDNENVSFIAQKLFIPEAELLAVSKNIEAELLKRRKSYVLAGANASTFNHTPYDSEESAELADTRNSPDAHHDRVAVLNAFSKLDWQEQYLVDSMVIGSATARSMLVLFEKYNISLGKSAGLEPLTEQKIYYHLRKTLIKLKSLMEKSSKP